MLIRFSVENFLSFGAKAEFSAVATREMHHRERTYKAPIEGLRLLPVAAFYGANASGKSNLFKALKFVQSLVVTGTAPGAQIPVKPFRLDPERLQQPSRFAVEFLAEGRSYLYEFSVTTTAVVDESLIEKGATTDMEIFRRSMNSAGESVFEFGSHAASKEKIQFLRFVGMGTRSNQLFLHEALDHNVQELKDVVEWFAWVLVLISPNDIHNTLAVDLHRQEDLMGFCNTAIQRIGAGIDLIKTEFTDLESTALPLQLKARIQSSAQEAKIMTVRSPKGKRYYITKVNGEIKVAKLASYHRNSVGTLVRFEIEEESDGTQRVLDLLPMIRGVGDVGCEHVVFIDELDRSLHSMLTRMLIESYLEARTKESKAQIFFTTHDATLLEADLLRRDEVWLIDKNDAGETAFASLSDFDLRSDKKLMRDYMLGRFGGIPKLRPIRWNVSPGLEKKTSRK